MNAKHNAEQKNTPDKRINRVPGASEAELETELMRSELKGALEVSKLPDHVTARPFRQAVVLREQKRRGNAFVQRMIARRADSGSISPGQIQRHPPGAGISADTGAVASEVQNPRPARPSDGHMTEETSAEAPATTAAGAGPASPTATGAQAPTPTGAQAPATTGTTSEPASQGAAPTAAEGPTPPVPAPATSLAMDSTRAQTILQDAFGSVRRIIPVTTILLEDNAATWTKYDEINVGRNNIYVTPRRPWRNGDAQAAFPSGLNGFADGGTIYVNKQTSSPTTTCHEMLHSNTAADFRGKVGEAINEGATQYLTIKALTAAGVALPASIPYATQVGIVRKLVQVVGEEILISSYFGGAAPLIETFELLMGRGMFPVLKIFLDAQNWEVAEIFLQPPSAQQRIAAINALLDFWVSDEDLDRIESVFNAANDADKEAIRTAIRPRIISLMNIGQRLRLRSIMGTF